MDIKERISILIAIIITIVTILYYIYMKKLGEINMKLNRMDLKRLVISWITAITVGLIIRSINNKTTIDMITIYYQHMHQVFKLVIILLCGELFFYNNSKAKIISKYSEVLSYITYANILSIVVINNIYIEKLIPSIIWGGIFYFIKFYEQIFENKILLITEKNNEPITSKLQLYPQRRTELEHIENYINEHVKDSSCTISVCADWGEGKTSFINVIKNEVTDNNDYVMFIQPMIMDSRESLIKYFFSQMEMIMRKEGIYTGKGSSISNYFNSIMNIIGKNSKNLFDSIFLENNKESKDYRELKVKLQKDIDKILSINSQDQGKLILLVDDFDRVEDDVMYQVLTFIKEIASFRGCLVIFLMDYKNITSKSITRDYLDKFVSKKFELKKVSRDEIIKYYITNSIYFDEKVIHDEIVKEQYVRLKEKIFLYLNNIEKILNRKTMDISKRISEEISKPEKNQKSNEDMMAKLEKDLSDTKECIKRYKELSSNPRRIKKLLTEIEDVSKFIYKKYKNESNEDISSTYETLNCDEIIFNMSMIKVIFELEFDELVESFDILEYMHNVKDTNIIKLLFDIDIFDRLKEIKQRGHMEKCKFINEHFINSHSSSKSILEIRTRNKEILHKLNNDTIYSSEENYEILDVIKAIYEEKYEKDIYIIEKELDLLYQYISYMLNDNKIKFNQVIETILQHRSRVYYNDNIQTVQQMLKRIILKLVDDKYTYTSIQEKDNNIYHINDFKNNIVFRSISEITSLLRSAKIDSQNYDYATLHNTINQKENIKDINSLAMNALKKSITTEDKEKRDSELLSQWVEESIKIFIDNDKINQNYKDGFKYIHQYMRSFVKVIEVLENIEDKINNTKIKPIYEIIDMYIFDNVENLQKEISILKEYVSNISEITNMKKVYRYFDEITFNTYKIIKMQSEDENLDISSESIDNLSYIYDELSERYKEEYLDAAMWSYCSLNMINIKTMMKPKVSS